jgi:hypothetical protein
MMAPTGIQVPGADGQMVRTNRAPIPAPEVTPTTEGSASGLRTAPCIMEPATAKEAPARTATRMRGRRKLRITLRAISSPWPVITAITSVKGIRRAPAVNPYKNNKTKAMLDTMTRIGYGILVPT